MMKKVTIPAPLIVVIEDVGWWNGFDGSAVNQPFRTGIGRGHCSEDYRTLVKLGKELGIQIIAGFAWCEWDRFNVLKKTPTATWMGEQWDNPEKNSPFFEETIDIINNNPAHIELAFHGLGHEYWKDDIPQRTEFHDLHGNMRSENDIKNHFHCFEEIYQKSGIKAALPVIFIPPALKHSFGNQYSGFQKILNDYGYKVVITAFDKAKQHSDPLYKNFTKECGITLVERGLSPVKWNEVAAQPVFSFQWPVLGLHWSNILHLDPQKNDRIIKMWAGFLKEGVKNHGLILLSGAKEAIVQLIYSRLSEISMYENGVTIDITKAQNVLPAFPDANLHIKVDINPEDTIKVGGGVIASSKTNERFEKVLKIIPLGNIIQLKINSD